MRRISRCKFCSCRARFVAGIFYACLDIGECRQHTGHSFPVSMVSHVQQGGQLSPAHACADAGNFEHIYWFGLTNDSSKICKHLTNCTLYLPALFDQAGRLEKQGNLKDAYLKYQIVDVTACENYEFSERAFNRAVAIKEVLVDP